MIEINVVVLNFVTLYCSSMRLIREVLSEDRVPTEALRMDDTRPS